MLSNADLLLYQQKYDEAFLQFDSILSVYPGHSLSDEIYMKKAQFYINKIYFKQVW